MPTIASPGALKAVADPLRIRMGLLMFQAPRTVKELAAALDVPPTRLYYHVRILEQHGLIEVVERRMVSGIEERRYGAVVENWSVGEDLHASALADGGILGAMFGAVHAEMDVAIHDAPDVPIGDPESAVPVLVLTELVLTGDELRDVQQRLNEIMLTFGDRADPPADGRPYHFMMAGYRRPRAS